MPSTPPPDPKDISRAYEALFYPVEEPDCIKCHDTGLLREKGQTYCQCKLGRRLAEQGMVAGEHGL